MMRLITLAVCVATPAVAQTLPDLRSGDLVFQTSTGGQSAAVLAATGHPYTHMGIVRLTDAGPVVVEAWSTVRETPLDQWIAQGDDRQITILRDARLDAAQAASMASAATAYIGRPYDIFFLFGNEGIYCSELPWLAYQRIDVPLGRVQRFADLNIADQSVQALIAERWRRDPVCAENANTPAECQTLLLDRQMITPAAVAADPNMQQVYSTFPD
jgi:Permuted papain-like amidase enzyme, YaeF/YiiX, C92 family